MKLFLDMNDIYAPVLCLDTNDINDIFVPWIC